MLLFCHGSSGNICMGRYTPWVQNSFLGACPHALSAKRIWICRHQRVALFGFKNRHQFICRDQRPLFKPPFSVPLPEAVHQSGDDAVRIFAECMNWCAAAAGGYGGSAGSVQLGFHFHPRFLRGKVLWSFCDDRLLNEPFGQENLCVLGCWKRLLLSFVCPSFLPFNVY